MSTVTNSRGLFLFHGGVNWLLLNKASFRTLLLNVLQVSHGGGGFTVFGWSCSLLRTSAGCCACGNAAPHWILCGAAQPRLWLHPLNLLCVGHRGCRCCVWDLSQPPCHCSSCIPSLCSNSTTPTSSSIWILSLKTMNSTLSWSWLMLGISLR